MSVTPWQIANVPGHIVAKKLKAEKLVEILKESAHPLLIVGKLEDYELEIAKTFINKIKEKDGTVVFTPIANKTFLEDGIKPDMILGLTEVTSKLSRGWRNVEGKESFDLLIYFGGYYYHQSQMLSAIKHYATDLKKISLNRYHQPNADYSFANPREQRWLKEMKTVLEAI